MRTSWKLRSIDELAHVSRGRSRHRPRNDPSLYGGEYPFVQTAEIHASDLYITSFSQTYSEAGLEQSRMWEPGVICITNAGENTGDCAILGIRACFPDSILAVQPIANQADPVFLKYAIDLLKPQLRRVTRGATQDNLSAAKLLAFKFPAPSFSVQARIGEALRNYGDLIENNSRRMSLLEESARQLYQEWFVRLRFPGHQGTTTAVGVPDGWQSRRSLAEFVQIKKGKNITRATSGNGAYPVVAGGLEPAYFHNAANAKEPVVTISASGANAGFVNIYLEDIWASDCSFISAQSTPDLYYLYCLLKHKQPEIFAFQQGAAQPHVYPKHLQRLCFVCPPKSLLQHFAGVVEPCFNLMANLKSQNQKLSAARDLLLPRLMNGELVV